MSYVRLNPASAVQEVSNTSGTSVASGTSTSVCSITLANTGVWLITGYAQFATNATGYRLMNINQTSGSTTTDSAYAASSPACSGIQTVVGKVFLVNLSTAGATYHLNARQNSGSTLTVYGRLRAIRIS